MTKVKILNDEKVALLETKIEESTRSRPEGVQRFVEPASGTLARAKSRQHHLVFGRRGSGKSSLLRKAAADLTVDRRPMAFVDLETFKGHAYPDVLVSVLIKTFTEFASWLDQAAVAPASKLSFWKRLFGTRPTRPAFNRADAGALAIELRTSVEGLNTVLFREDSVETELKDTKRVSEGSGATAAVEAGVGPVSLKLADETRGNSETDRQETQKFTASKLDHLHRHIMEYQGIFRRMAKLSAGDAFLFLDDLYHIRRRDQALVLDYFHRIAKGNNLWLKVGTIRHRTQWYVNGDPPIGTKIGDDISEIDLDLTLEKFAITKAFLQVILGAFMEDAGLIRDEILSSGAFDRLVLASGGVTRDFLGIFLRSIPIARSRGDSARGEKVGVEDVNAAAGEYDSSKREELSRDTLDERRSLEDEFEKIGKFVREKANANVFLVDKDLAAADTAAIEELVDLRLVHRVKTTVTVRERPGRKYQAFMLDVSQYTAARKRRDFEIIEFWRSDATDAIRRTGLIYKEAN